MEDKVYSILKKLEYLEEKMNDLNVNIEMLKKKIKTITKKLTIKSIHFMVNSSYFRKQPKGIF
jgi:peptidoglycan hydrolase CwlO-like protein